MTIQDAAKAIQDQINWNKGTITRLEGLLSVNELSGKDLTYLRRIIDEQKSYASGLEFALAVVHFQSLQVD